MKYIEISVGETLSLSGQLLTFTGYDDQNVILKDVRTGKTYVHGRATVRQKADLQHVNNALLRVKI